MISICYLLNNRNYIYEQWEKDCKNDDDTVLIIIKSAAQTDLLRKI